MIQQMIHMVDVSHSGCEGWKSTSQRRIKALRPHHLFVPLLLDSLDMETASFVLQNEGTHVQAQLCSRIGKYSARLGRLFDSGSAQSLGSFSTYIDCLMGTSARSASIIKIRCWFPLAGVRKACCCRVR